jgi:hypothetical protein
LTKYPGAQDASTGLGTPARPAAKPYCIADEAGVKQTPAIAAHCVTKAAENDGPMIFARMGMMQAINRHKPVEFDPERKSPHWGKRKLKRDQ